MLTNFHLVASPNPQTFQITIPANATLNPTFARFRLTTAAYLDSIGGKLLSTDVNHVHPNNGEVEDWDVQFVDFAGGGFGGQGSSQLYTTWQTNQIGPFRDPDPYFHDATRAPEGFLSPGYDRRQYFDPLADPSIVGNRPDDVPGSGRSSSDPAIGNDQGRIDGHYELMPGMFANGAGYTVSQGYGSSADQVGYAHGVIDAELAVQMARQWDTLGQNMAPGTEKTVTTFVSPGSTIIPAEKGNLKTGLFLVPGGMNGPGGSGFISYWNEYEADPPAPFALTSRSSWPIDTRGFVH